MEVHAHSLDRGNQQGHHKRWTHYLWEFVMLFLAVFCGFLAENIRENNVEHKRGKEYIQSLIRDLETDTATVRISIQRNLLKATYYDSLCNRLKRPDPFRNINMLYYFFLPTTYYNPFRASEGTIQQLENAGGLRLIRDKQATDSIVSYYRLVRASEGQLNTYLRYFDQYHTIAFQVFDYSQVDTLFYSRERILSNGANYSLLTTDKTMIKILFNKLFALRFILASYLGYLSDLEQEAKSTLQFLKKEYDMK